MANPAEFLQVRVVLRFSSQTFKVPANFVCNDDTALTTGNHLRRWKTPAHLPPRTDNASRVILIVSRRPSTSPQRHSPARPEQL